VSKRVSGELVALHKEAEGANATTHAFQNRANKNTNIPTLSFYLPFISKVSISFANIPALGLITLLKTRSVNHIIAPP
jgi:hypothetical protein